MKYFSIAMVVLGLYGGNTFAQVGMNGNNPDKSAILDLRAATSSSPKQGLLIPNVSLTNVTNSSPIISTPVTSLLVYNTNALVTGGSGIGYYYWDGAKWNKLAISADVPAADNLGNHRATMALQMTNHDIDSIRTATILKEVRISDQNTANTNLFYLRKGSGKFGIWNKNLAANALTIDEANNNVGIGTTTPSNTLTVQASADPLKLVGLSPSVSGTDNTLVIGTDGVVRKGAPLPNLVPNDVGTVIATGGQLVVAQEITAEMSADSPIPTVPNDGTLPGRITNLSNVIIDNKNMYNPGGASGNSFTIGADGIYLITMNLGIGFPSAAGIYPVFGIWCDTDGEWVARVNDQFVGTTISPGGTVVQTYTLITAIQMNASKTYSYRYAISTADASAGGQGYILSTSGTSGIASYCSLKRLK